MHRPIRDGQEMLAIFRGDDAYISPNHHPSKPEHHRHDPAWNYQVVHAYGAISFQHDDQAKRAAVRLLTSMHKRKPNSKDAWRMADAPADYMRDLLGGIVAFRVEVTRMLAKSKLSQNQQERDYLGVVSGLRASGQDAMAKLMNDRRDPTD